MKRAKQIFFGVLIVLVVIDLFVPKEEALFPGQAMPGFMAVYGFVSCTLIIVISKLIGKMGISKKEEYYDE